MFNSISSIFVCRQVLFILVLGKLSSSNNRACYAQILYSRSMKMSTRILSKEDVRDGERERERGRDWEVKRYDVMENTGEML